MAKRKEKGKIESGITVKEMAKLYCVSEKTFHAWLKPLRNKLGDVTGKSLFPKQIKIIIDHLDLPDFLA